MYERFARLETMILFKKILCNYVITVVAIVMGTAHKKRASLYDEKESIVWKNVHKIDCRQRRHCCRVALLQTGRSHDDFFSSSSSSLVYSLYREDAWQKAHDKKFEDSISKCNESHFPRRNRSVLGEGWNRSRAAYEQWKVKWLKLIIAPAPLANCLKFGLTRFRVSLKTYDKIRQNELQTQILISQYISLVSKYFNWINQCFFYIH